MSPTTSPPSDTTTGSYATSPFLENIIRFLMPYFLPVTQGQAEARADILESLAAYGAKSRPAMVRAAQAIAFGFASLESLQEAKDPSLSPNQRLRYRSCANTLTRTAEKAEKALTAEPIPAPQRPTAPLQTDISDAQAQAAIAFARDKIAEHRRKTGTAPPGRAGSILPSRPDLTPEQQAEHNLLWGHAFMRALDDLGMPVQRVAPS